jgi:predicted CXXCH cytochrome family protein
MKSLYFLILFIFLTSTSNNPIGPHGDKDGCPNCHKGRESQLIIEDSISLCNRCHSQDGGNHPVLKEPKKMINPLPLSNDEKIVCYTCHEPHNNSQYPFMLRMEPNSLCMNCHEK